MATATAPRKTATLRFTISREKLLEALAAVVPTAPDKTTLPVLGNILIVSEEGRLKFSGTDLDIGVETHVVADVEGNGAITVPAKRLLAIAKELSPAPVRFAVKADNVMIDCGRAHFTLRTLPREEFPSMPDIPFDRQHWRLKAGDLQSLAKRTTFAVSNEPSRPILHGVLLEANGPILRFVATDGHTLAIADQRTEGDADASLIVPAKFFAHVSRLFGSDEDVEIAHGENHLGIRSDFRTAYTRLIEGPYPNYAQVIPKKHDRTARVDRLALISSIRRLTPIASAQTHRLRLTFDTGRLQLAASTPDVGEAYDEIGIQLDGGKVDIGGNASYLLDVLTRMDGDEVMIYSASPDRAMIFKPAVKAEDSTTFFLVMPLRLLD
jgi:DNA polymerase-3 subunit beta